MAVDTGDILGALHVLMVFAITHDATLCVAVDTVEFGFGVVDIGWKGIVVAIFFDFVAELSMVIGCAVPFTFEFAKIGQTDAIGTVVALEAVARWDTCAQAWMEKLAALPFGLADAVAVYASTTSWSVPFGKDRFVLVDMACSAHLAKMALGKCQIRFVHLCIDAVTGAYRRGFFELVA